MPPRQLRRPKTRPQTKACKKAIAARGAEMRTAGAIVAQVLVHFGAGYGAEQLKENPAGALPNFQIFERPKELGQFHRRLLASTMKHAAKLHWNTDQAGRDAVCAAAFKHGSYARRSVAAGSLAHLDWGVIERTLRRVQDENCPGVGGAGGGLICDF